MGAAVAGPAPSVTSKARASMTKTGRVPAGRGLVGTTMAATPVLDSRRLVLARLPRGSQRAVGRRESMPLGQLEIDGLCCQVRGCGLVDGGGLGVASHWVV